MIESWAKSAKEAQRQLFLLSSEEKNFALKEIADALTKNKDKIFKANEIDLNNAKQNGISKLNLESLKLSPEKLKICLDNVFNIMKLKDEVGEIIESRETKNGLIIERIKCPLGVIGVISEFNPLLTITVISLALKSANAVILHGGNSALNTNRALILIIKNALAKTKIPKDIIQFIDSTDEALKTEMLNLKDYIEVIIPHGSKSFVDDVIKNSSIPVIKTSCSVVHAYIDSEVDFNKAIKIIIDSKINNVQARNALDTLLVHEKIAEKFLLVLAEEFKKQAKEKDLAMVEIRADVKSHKILEGYPTLAFVNLDDFDTEFLDYIMSIKVVSSLEEAINHIFEHSQKYCEAIITENKTAGQRFLKEVDSACVLLNTPTCLAEGNAFGLGNELGFSTQKLQARGPFGVEGILSYKWVVRE